MKHKRKVCAERACADFNTLRQLIFPSIVIDIYGKHTEKEEKTNAQREKRSALANGDKTKNTTMR